MTPELGPPIEVLHPDAGALPLVISSPHSGQIYPPSMVRELRLPVEHLRCLEDGQVDWLFGAAPALGAPLLRARFARGYVDPNREAFELDPALFDRLPDHVNANPARARAGLGTIPSRIGGEEIYRWRLSFDEAEQRVRLAYRPYHHALQNLLDQAHAAFGTVLLLDCHSMPSLAPNGAAATEGAIDFALGDRFGRSCSPLVVGRVEATLRRHGFRVARNRPYALAATSRRATAGRRTSTRCRSRSAAACSWKRTRGARTAPWRACRRSSASSCATSAGSWPLVWRRLPSGRGGCAPRPSRGLSTTSRHLTHGALGPLRSELSSTIPASSPPAGQGGGAWRCRATAQIRRRARWLAGAGSLPRASVDDGSA